VNTPIAFLKHLQPLGPWCLCCQKPDKSNAFIGERFSPDESHKCERWIAEQNSAGNQIWYRAAAIRQGVNAAFASDADVIGTRVVWIDIDPDKGSDRDTERANIFRVLTTDLPSGVKPPSLIIDSGNGFQALYVFKTPWKFSNDDEREDFRAINRWLAARFGGNGGDKCFSPNHLLRLPGTINFKRKVGDTFPVASIVKSDGPNEYGPNDFERLKDDRQRTTGDVVPPAHTTAMPPRRFADDASDIPVTERMRAIIVNGNDPLEPNKYGDSMNEWQHGVTIAMMEAVAAGKMTVDEVRSVLSDSRFGVSKAILTQGNGSGKRSDRRNWQNYLERQLDKARKAASGNAEKRRAEQRSTHNAAEGFITSGDDGKIAAENQHNIRVAVEKLGVVVKHNVFANRTLIIRDGTEEILNDKRWKNLWLEIDRTFKFRPRKEFFEAVVFDLAYRNSFHPVKDYLDSLKWDGVERIGNWLHTYGGVEDTDYTQAVGRITLIAAVRRIRQPGCKFDEMLILESELQGKNKSTALQILAVRPEWFNDTLPLGSDVNRKVEAMAGRWIVEAGELSGMSEAGVAKLKNFLSSRCDVTRLAYESVADEFPRQCIIIGTTNKTLDVFQDETGNRRYWPVKIQNFDIDALARDREQLWAEAVTAEAAGESIRLDPTLYTVAGEQQERRREVSPLEQQLAPMYGPGTAGGKVPTEKVWEVLEVHNIDKKQQLGKEVGRIMRSFGWERTRIGGERRYYYVRPEQQADLYKDYTDTAGA
jgi:hypothetical protein